MTTCNCGANWTGRRIEHCTECHATFTGTSSGDRHRVGDHAVSTGPDRRRCLTPAEMRRRGMELNSRGQWTLGGVSPWARTPEIEPTGLPVSDADRVKVPEGDREGDRAANRATATKGDE